MKKLECDEDGPYGGQTVKYKGIEYTIGNRRHGQVELFLNRKFVMVVKMCKNFTFRKL